MRRSINRQLQDEVGVSNKIKFTSPAGNSYVEIIVADTDIADVTSSFRLHSYTVSLVTATSRLLPPSSSSANHQSMLERIGYILSRFAAKSIRTAAVLGLDRSELRQLDVIERIARRKALNIPPESTASSKNNSSHSQSSPTRLHDRSHLR